MRKRLCPLLLLITFLMAVGQSGQPSTPEERARAVQVVQKLEANPLDPSLRPEREWLLKWVAEAPDIHVNLCAGQQEFKKKFKHGPETTFQKLASATAFVIEHPE